MQILLEPVQEGSQARVALESVYADLRQHRLSRLQIVTDPFSSEFGTHRADAVLPQEPSLRIDEIAPSPRVLICGAGLDVHPLVKMIKSLHWTCEVMDHRLGLLEHPFFEGIATQHLPGRLFLPHFSVDPYIAAIVMSHHLESDRDYLRALSATSLGYIGLLGPSARRERLLSMLAEPVAAALRSRLRSPIGLNIGACTPESIALAIVAELHQFARDTSR
jgi:xanthine/CO dehydrogenase XdhC/CoxF family maturation factor